MTEHSPLNGLIHRELLASGKKKKKKAETENFPGECRNFTCREQKADGSNFCETHRPKSADDSVSSTDDPFFFNP